MVRRSVCPWRVREAFNYFIDPRCDLIQNDGLQKPLGYTDLLGDTHFSCPKVSRNSTCKLSHKMGWRFGLKHGSRSRRAKDRPCFLCLYDLHFTGMTQQRRLRSTEAGAGPSETPEWVETNLARRESPSWAAFLSELVARLAALLS